MSICVHTRSNKRAPRSAKSNATHATYECRYRRSVALYVVGERLKNKTFILLTIVFGNASMCAFAYLLPVSSRIRDGWLKGAGAYRPSTWLISRPLEFLMRNNDDSRFGDV